MITDKNTFEKIVAYEICIGNKSMISGKNAMHINDAKEIICNYLYKNKVDFSLKILGGGYTYNNETFDHESTISLLFIGGDIYQQKEKLRIAEAAKNYLLAELAKRGCK